MGPESRRRGEGWTAAQRVRAGAEGVGWVAEGGGGGGVGTLGTQLLARLA